MKVLILEDEKTAADRLTHMLAQCDPGVEVVAVLQGVAEATGWILQNPGPDLAFFDVQLADAASFDLFNTVEVKFPVIFTTAYDQYILQALEHNSIDYLLKPISQDRLHLALQKVKRLESHFLQQNMKHLFDFTKEKIKKRFVVKKGVDFVSITVKSIRYFFTEHKLVFLRDADGATYIIDRSLSDLAHELEDQYFFRANRKYLVNIESIVKFKSSNGKIIIQLVPATSEQVVISKENAPNFRRWIESQ